MMPYVQTLPILLCNLDYLKANVNDIKVSLGYSQQCLLESFVGGKQQLIEARLSSVYDAA